MMFHFVPFLLAAVLHVDIILKGDAADADCTKLYAAGWNRCGQFGNGEALGWDGDTVKTPVLVETHEGGLLCVSAGEAHSAIVKHDGTVWTTGYNKWGQLGHDDTNDRSTFTQVHGMNNITKVVAGYENTFFVSATGEVFATGRNVYGELGVGDTINRYAPVKVAITDVVEIAAGGYHVLFKKSDGTVYATGLNSAGRLCIGDNVDWKTPVQITALSGVAEIAAGFYHSAFLTDDGEVWTCGNNFLGQLGLGDNTSRKTPTRVSGFSSVLTSVAATFGSTFFLLADGTVHSTGYNEFGGLGVGDYDDRNAPVAVPIDGVTDIFGSEGLQLFFQRNDGSIWGTEDDLSYEFRVGDTANENKPTDIVSLADDGMLYVEGGSDFTLFVADGPCPSEAPSSAPSSAPSDTSAPTNTPSVVPSQSLPPAASPTTKPTEEPTEAPTNASTNAPANASTNAPTSDAAVAYPMVAFILILGTLELFVVGW